MRTILRKLLSKDAWKRAWFLMLYHDPSEVPNKIVKQDYVPIALAIMLTVLLMGIIGLIVWLIRVVLR